MLNQFEQKKFLSIITERIAKFINNWAECSTTIKAEEKALGTIYLFHSGGIVVIQSVSQISNQPQCVSLYSSSFSLFINLIFS